MKNQSKKSIKIQGIEIDKKNENLDNANLNSLKGEISSPSKMGNLYKNFSHLSAKDQKKERGKLRRKLESFRNSILGKDRKEEERKESIKEFIAFYKMHWIIQDFKFESFSHQRDADFKKDWESILSLCKKELEK